MPTYLHGALSAHLPPPRLVSRATQEYAGACLFCGGDERRSDRFHVWLMPAGRERYWCRRCNRKGLATELLGSSCRTPHNKPNVSAGARPSGPTPQHIPFYRQLYDLVTTWAAAQLHQPCNPEPLKKEGLYAYIRSPDRGRGDAGRHRAGPGHARDLVVQRQQGGEDRRQLLRQGQRAPAGAG